MSEAREDRFCALHEGTRPHIIAYALRRTASPDDAADVVAETFEIAWRRLDDIPAEAQGATADSSPSAPFYSLVVPGSA